MTRAVDRESAADLIYWWACEQDPLFDNHTEIVKMILGHGGVCVLHNAAEKPNLSESERQKLIN